MRPLRGALRRRWPLLAALPLSLLLVALVTAPWPPAAYPARVTVDPSPPAAAEATSGQRLEFYGAARNLFSNDGGAADVVIPSPRPSDASASTQERVLARYDRPPDADPVIPPSRPSDASAPTQERVFSHYDRSLEPADAAQAVPLSDAWLLERERVYAERRRRLRDACDRHRVRLADTRTERSVLPPRAVDADMPVEEVKVTHFTVVPELKTMTCLVNKAASTSLLGTFLKLAGHGVPLFSDLASPHSIAKLLNPTKPGQFELAKKQYFKFIFVRHPLERLISAYEDKVVRADHPSLLDLRKAIFAAYEDIHFKQNAYRQLRFSVDNETAVRAEYDAQLAEYREDVRRRNEVPSFSEFLEFALAKEPTGDTFDSHWTPYWRQCAPCHIDYDVIGTLETGADDFKYVWRRMNIYDSVKIPRQNALPRNVTDRRQLARHYLGPVRAETVARLRDAFRLDFEMFGYDWERMLRAAGHCAADGPCPLA